MGDECRPEAGQHPADKRDVYLRTDDQTHPELNIVVLQFVVVFRIITHDIGTFLYLLHM